jgi:hypothetical protein
MRGRWRAGQGRHVAFPAVPRPPAGSLGSRQQSVLDALAAAGDQPMTVRQLAEAIGRATPSGERGLREAVDELDEKGLVAVERRVVLAVESKGIRQWRPAKPGETPEHRAGDPVPGVPGRRYRWTSSAPGPASGGSCCTRSSTTSQKAKSFG